MLAQFVFHWQRDMWITEKKIPQDFLKILFGL